MNEIEVRPAKTADESAILALAKIEMEAHVHLDERFRLREDAARRYAIYLRDRMRDIDSSVFVAADAGRVVGLAIGTVRKVDSFFESQRFGYVSDLMVASAARRRGVGRALYERVAAWFRSLGIETARLHVAVQSDEARAFWKSVGAKDFLVEAWIDLKEAAAAEPPPTEPPADTEAAPPPVAPAEPRRSGFDYPGDVLTGPEGSR